LADLLEGEDRCYGATMHASKTKSMRRLLLSSTFMASAVLGCAPSKTPADQGSAWETKLDHRCVLEPKADRRISVKRDVHSIEIDADAGKLADAFHRTMTDPDKHFGLIHVMRKAQNRGKPFSLNERFQGRYALEDALNLKGEFWAQVLRGIEDKFTSDYGIISLLVLNPPRGEDYRMQYVYLEGSPIAGSSTFIIHPLGPARSRLTQVFEYQELDPSFVEFFATDGLKLHNQVVYSQGKQAADLIGAHIVDTDIPEAYRQP
jgi:hypothetical protein